MARRRRSKRQSAGTDEASVRLYAAFDLAARTLWPYLGDAIRALTPVEVPGMGTLGVDRWWRLYWDPAVVLEWTVHQLAVVLLHETAHVVRNHPDRCTQLGAHPHLANICEDAEINDDLDEDRQHWDPVFALPEGAILPETIGCERGGLWEEYYQQLLSQTNDCPTCGGGGQSGDVSGPSGGSGSSDSDGDEDEADGDPDGSGSAGSDDGDEGRGDGGSEAADDDDDDDEGSDSDGGVCPDCGRPRGKGGWHGKGDGSGATGVQAPWEAGPPNSDNAAGVSDGEVPPGLSNAEAGALRRVVAQRIVEHTRNRGRVPGGWQRFADATLEAPKVPWERQLTSAVRGCCQQVAGAVDYSYSRPGRRASACPGIAMPALRRPLPRVSVILDTSGSMSEAMIAAALSEVTGVCRAAGADVTVLSVDADVHTQQRVVSGRAVHVVGGGGTDMRVGIDAALEARPKPNVIVVLTDGWTPWPKHPLARRTKLVVGIVGNGRDDDVPSWAHVVRIPLDEAA